jgi:hypothetical protein
MRVLIIFRRKSSIYYSIRSEITVGDLVQTLYYVSTKLPTLISDQWHYLIVLFLDITI